ncbi:2-amino-4-hydroxy-6-hydroxymethyldihydropteridine diphosphokinase [Candidatus Puniceispirillum marinum]|uniref:2-amino-4-hydroxy-6-hydroxymethyldihydropteridine pyrophosphokinase n=1 Tax=Puniceispirillum marinum (strain IMCC1322) TaxID=488538 RepID=D5BR84_PUNMI|nr:2-amino-4-hydroxy-6-hydroxymethyldihydropteridine diphosphokinase [Candidatus Puniceispirillum marinum]ADE38781.1 7,8-Dihydro-6-hydroxymethylpterin-pyrophosphokinase, HPPK [Candidatus Puniceispirillum marinum IMCC1322]
MQKTDIYLGIGANLTPDGFNSPQAGCEAALDGLSGYSIDIIKISRWFESAPVPVSDQPWFKNAVIHATTSLNAAETLTALHKVEAQFGRQRRIRNEARVLDIDLLDFGGMHSDDESLLLPHPRMHQRAFVLLPLQDLAPDWVHPVTGDSIQSLIDTLPDGQIIRPVS